MCCVRLVDASLEVEANGSSSSIASLIVLSFGEVPIVLGIVLAISKEVDSVVATESSD